MLSFSEFRWWWCLDCQNKARGSVMVAKIEEPIEHGNTAMNNYEDS